MKNTLLLGRRRTCDVAYPFVMPSGFAGDVNRGHPASILPNQLDPDAPLVAFGQACVASTANPNTVRAVGIADNGLSLIFGVSVRPYPFQQSAAVNYGAIGFGDGAPALVQPVDILRGGYILVPVVGTPIKGGAVYLWTAAASGDHVVGGFEAAPTGGSTSALDTALYEWNSPPDANGLAELIIKF